MNNESNNHCADFDDDKKTRNIFVVSLIVYLVVVALNGRGVWPFNANAILSQPGQAWTRPLIRDVTSVPDSLIWRNYSVESLPGAPIALKTLGVEQNDFASLIERMVDLGLENQEAVRLFLGDRPNPDEKWLVMLVTGKLISSGDVSVRAEPYLLLTQSDKIKFHTFK